VTTLYVKRGISGGSSTALDGLHGQNCKSNDFAIVLNDADSQVYFYELDLTSGEAEDLPSIVSPDISPSDRRWKNLAVYGASSGGTLINSFEEDMATYDGSGLITELI
jgi:hypothetical protein